MQNVKCINKSLRSVNIGEFKEKCIGDLKEKGYINISVSLGKKGLHVDYNLPNSDISVYEYILYPWNNC